MIYDENLLNVAVGQFLKKLRIQNGLSGKELGILLKVTQQQISRYENGITPLTIVRLNQYLKVFGLNWYDFMIRIENEVNIDN